MDTETKSTSVNKEDQGNVVYMLKEDDCFYDDPIVLIYWGEKDSLVEFSEERKFVLTSTLYPFPGVAQEKTKEREKEKEKNQQATRELILDQMVNLYMREEEKKLKERYAPPVHSTDCGKAICDKSEWVAPVIGAYICSLFALAVGLVLVLG